MVLINEEGYEEGVFEKTSEVEYRAAPRIINTDQDTERASKLEGNIKKLAFGSHRWSHNQFKGCCGTLAYRYNGGG